VGSDAVYLWDDVKFESTTAISQIQKTNILIYSVNRQIVVNINEDQINGTIDVYDLSGKKIKSSFVNGNITQINLKSKGISL